LFETAQPFSYPTIRRVQPFNLPQPKEDIIKHYYQMPHKTATRYDPKDLVAIRGPKALVLGIPIIEIEQLNAVLAGIANNLHQQHLADR